MSKKYLFPVATVAALALAVPTVAAAKPSIGVDSSPSCAGFSFTAESPGEAFAAGRYTVTAQEYDSVTVQPVGEETVFTGTVEWGETVTVTIPAADDYLLWTYRVDASADGEGLTTYGERQLDCRPVEQPEPEPEAPGDDAPEVPEVEEPETPEAPEVEAPEVPKSAPVTPPTLVVTDETTTKVVERIGTPISVESPNAATPVVAEPRTVG